MWVVSKKNLLYFKILDAEEIINFNENYNGYFINSLNTITSNPFFKFKEFICNKFHFIGNMFGLKCTACGHPTSSHHSMNRTSWRCDECDAESNICSIEPEETWGDFSSLLERVKNSI